MSRLDAYFLVEQALAPLFWGVFLALAIAGRVRRRTSGFTLVAAFAILMFAASVLKAVGPDYGPAWAKGWMTHLRSDAEKTIGFWEYWLRYIAMIPLALGLLALIYSRREQRSQHPPAS